MAVKQMSDLIGSGMDRAVELMSVAAYTSFRFSERNSVKFIAIEKEDLEQIAEYCFSLGDMSPLAARDGRNLVQMMKEPCSLLVMGDKRKSDFNYDCGACGFASCAGMNRAQEVESLTANGPSCLFKNMNMGIAANAAASMAHKLGLHCRVFSTLAFSAKALEIIEGVDICISVCVSAGKKNPFFDRHEYWTREHWDEIFAREFPTYTRGFIGAVED
ncbi:MAG: hypothetical protein GXP56_09630 [Deltaproteobacteria bacterium]|nr:hypothetical protein [Deltaproteobacteria bacterium]